MNSRDITEAKNAENAKDRKMLVIIFKQVFGSAHGIKVLAELEKQTGMNTSSARQAGFDVNKTMFYEGQRSVFLAIKNILNTEVEDNE